MVFKIVHRPYSRNPLCAKFISNKQVIRKFKVLRFYCISPAGKGLTSWLLFVVSTVSLKLSHWYPGSGVVLDCIDS